MCKRVLKKDKSLLTARGSIVFHKFGSLEYWCLCESVLNKGKSSISPLFNQFEVLLYSTNKTGCFVCKLFSNSTLDTPRVLLIDFSFSIESLLCDMTIIESLLSDFISKVDLYKVMRT